MSLEQTVPFSQSTVEVSGCRVSVRRSHSGAAAPTVLYLHGVNGLGELAPFMQNLGRDFDLIVPEHPGFGASEEPAWLDNIHDLAYFYLDFIEQLELAQVVLVGSSIGGWLAGCANSFLIRLSPIDCLRVAIRSSRPRRRSRINTVWPELPGSRGCLIPTWRSGCTGFACLPRLSGEHRTS